MPFLIGKSPIRYTLKYLEQGRLHLLDQIKILSINYNDTGAHHEGARQFVFWYLPQIQYKNPNVQMVSLKNMTPTPFFRCFFDDGKELLIDVDSQTKESILKICLNTIGKSKDQQTEEEVKINPSIFGIDCERGCICEIPGQCPCPGVVKMPDHMRGKIKYAERS